MKKYLFTIICALLPILASAQEEEQYWIELRSTVDYGADVLIQARNSSSVDPWMIEELEMFLERGNLMYNEHTADEEEVRHMIEELNWIIREIEEAMTHQDLPGGSNPQGDGDNDGGTDIEKLRIENSKFSDGEWYSLDGRRLEGRPTKKGVYVKNGKKLVIK